MYLSLFKNTFHGENLSLMMHSNCGAEKYCIANALPCFCLFCRNDGISFFSKITSAPLLFTGLKTRDRLNC